MFKPINYDASNSWKCNAFDEWMYFLYNACLWFSIGDVRYFKINGSVVNDDNASALKRTVACEWHGSAKVKGKKTKWFWQDLTGYSNLGNHGWTTLTQNKKKSRYVVWSH